MPLNFPKHLTIGSTEWKVQPFKFDIEKINGGYSPSYKDVVLSGVSPLSLPNAQANGLKYIKLFGKCETLNLINKNTMTPNCYINTNGDIVTNNKNLDITDYIEVTAGKLYHYTATSYGTSPHLAYYDSNKELLGTIAMADVKDYTPTTGTVYVRLSVYKTSLEVASFTDDVSPTNPVPIMFNNGAVNSWLYNLFDSSKATLNYYINSSGNEQYNANWACSDYIEVVEGGTYRLRGVSSYGTSPRTGFYKADKTFVSQRSQSSSAFTIPEDNDIKYMRMSIYKTNIDTATIQQELKTIETISMNGQTATAQDLLSCDDYKDEQNITTGEVIRKVDYRIIDGTENWVEYSGSSSTGYMYTLYNTQADPTTFVVMSTHFKGVRSNYAISNMVIGEAKCLGQTICVCAAQDTVENFKTWLANQYNNNTPVIFVYPKATPTTETVTPQTNIQTVSGNNTLTITQASVDMLEMEVKYSAGVEVEIEG